MHMGIPYDDERGYAICGALTSIMCGESYATSAEMASFLGRSLIMKETRKVC